MKSAVIIFKTMIVCFFNVVGYVFVLLLYSN